ncbi:MAG: hypothetical protein JJE23_03125 [Thermoleophilia bacterium]|jgi:hypothetical protein|nr:hypothetical protein [Thermoleophilia bacterium]
MAARYRATPRMQSPLTVSRSRKAKAWVGRPNILLGSPASRLKYRSHIDHFFNLGGFAYAREEHSSAQGDRVRPALA